MSQQLLHPDIPNQIDAVFNRVIFPLLDDLLKAQVMARDPHGMPETRLRASVLLCKAFMQYEVNDAAREKDIRVLWIQILDLLDRLMNADRRDQLVSLLIIFFFFFYAPEILTRTFVIQREAIPESLKNVVLVMNAMGILVPPSSSPAEKQTERQKELWEATHERIERFLPGFLDDVIPSPPPPPVAATPTSSKGSTESEEKPSVAS